MYNTAYKSTGLAQFRPTFLCITIFLFQLAFASPGYSSQTLFYTGDPNDVEAIGDYSDPLGGPLSLSQIFQPFTVTSTSGWDVNSVYFNELDLATDPVTSAQWSIRTGMAPGVAGVTIASGSGATSGDLGSDDVFAVNGLNVILAPGTYWLNVTPETESGRLFANATSGANAVNAQLNGASLWYEPGVQNYAPTELDFSAGATGVVVPEPSTLWLLFPVGVGSVVLAYRRRRGSV